MGKEDSSYGRGWETFFFVSEAAMVVFYIIGTKYSNGAQSFAKNATDFAADNLAATNTM